MYLSKLDGGKVHSLDQLMEFMRDNAEKEMPPGITTLYMVFIEYFY